MLETGPLSLLFQDTESSFGVLLKFREISDGEANAQRFRRCWVEGGFFLNALLGRFKV